MILLSNLCLDIIFVPKIAHVILGKYSQLG